MQVFYALLEQPRPHTGPQALDCKFWGHTELGRNPKPKAAKLQSESYNVQFLHVPGKKNVTADTFSIRYDSPIARETTTHTSTNTLDT